MTTYATEKVGTTKDYSVFKYFDRNRVISKNHVEDLRKDMTQRGQLERVIVNERWFVIDGQHRIEARKLDKKPVDFRIKKGASIIDVTAINNSAKIWNNAAWLRNYSHVEHDNNKSYKQYATFKKQHGFTESICMALLSEDFHDYGRKSFKKGTFKVKNLERATGNANQIAELIAIDKRLNALKAVLAFLKLKTLTNFKYNVFESQLKKNKRRLPVCMNVEHWIDSFIDEIYNYNLRKPHKRLVNRHIS
jgi:hypothetical protein